MDNPELIIEGFLLPFSPEIESLAQQLRIYLKEETKPTTELIAESTISLNIGYGFTRKAWDCYAAIIVYTKHINISFPSGTSLTDPDGLLQGTGSRIRDIKVGNLNDLTEPAFKALLIQARDKAWMLAADSPTRQKKFKTFVRLSSGESITS